MQLRELNIRRTTANVCMMLDSNKILPKRMGQGAEFDESGIKNSKQDKHSL